MEYKLSDLIRKLPVVNCSVHKEECANTICLDKNCTGFFEILCPECSASNHPEHS